MLRLKKVSMRNCIECGFPVSGGGNRHAADWHVIRGKRGDRKHSLSAKVNTEMKALVFDARGVSVAGVGGGQAKTHRQGKKAAKALKGS